MRGYGTTIFAEMTALAQQTGAVNLGQGFPDTDGPNAMLEQAVDAIRGGLNQYPPGLGLPPLRQAIATHRHARSGLTYDPDSEIFVTVGATEAISASILALCEAGDEVVLLEPYYDSYAAALSLAGAVRKPIPLRPESPGGRFTFDPDDLVAAITPRTRLILLNSPHNPTGKVFTRAELEQIATLARDHDLIVVTDEVYEHLVFDANHVPIATLPGMRARTVAISSGGKTFSFTGWKVGWVCAVPALVTAVRTANAFLTYVSSGPFQPAIAAGLALSDEYFRELADDLRTKRDRLCAGLAEAGLEVYEPRGTYFVP